MGGSLSKKKKPKQPASGAALGELLAKCGMQKIVLVRHANAEPRDPEKVAEDFGELLKPGAPHAVRDIS
jgi:hypothetical protein